MGNDNIRDTRTSLKTTYILIIPEQAGQILREINDGFAIHYHAIPAGGPHVGMLRLTNKGVLWSSGTVVVRSKRIRIPPLARHKNRFYRVVEDVFEMITTAKGSMDPLPFALNPDMKQNIQWTYKRSWE